MDPETKTSEEEYLAQGDMFSMEPFVMVICGGAGDLSRRKLLPTIYHLYREGILPDQFSVIGFGMPELGSDEYRQMVKDSLQEFIPDDFHSADWEQFAEHIFYSAGSFDTDDSYHRLASILESQAFTNKNGSLNVLYYMAVPPAFFPVITLNIHRHKLNQGRINPRIIIEKPFGHNLASARELNATIVSAFQEHQIYRIDHYLGKETVQNIMYFRFSNSIFEPLWNRRYIDHVQITAAEDIGIEHRGKFYENAGVVRDIIQNHMLQLVGLVAMEPPAGFSADLIRDEKNKALKSLRPLSPDAIMNDMIRGQYGPGTNGKSDVRGYRQEENVAPESITPTFFAGKFFIDNWRWADVPFYVRAGKRLNRKLTQITIQFRMPPLRLFGKQYEAREPSRLILTIQPKEKITLRYHVKYPNSPNRTQSVNMEFSYEDAFHEKSYPAYSRLLIDCMKGDLTLFVRQDGIEHMWEFIDPVLEYWQNNPPEQFPNYDAGSWGPAESDWLLLRDGMEWLTHPSHDD